MPRANIPLYALNGGEIDKNAAARIDLQRNQYSAQLMVNWLPTVIGKMQFRPGLEYLLTSVGQEENKRLIPFVESIDTSFVLEMSENQMRVVSDGAYVENQAITNVLQNGDFSSFTGWTSAGTGGTASVVSNRLRLDGASVGNPIARQSVTVDSGEVNTDHTVTLTVDVGPIVLRIGTTAGGTDLMDMVAEEGSHILTFNPGGAATIYFDLVNTNNTRTFVDTCQILSTAGPIVVPHPWLRTDLASLRYFQSIDVIFVASSGFQQRRIERRGMRSWSIVRYKVNNGPFDVQPIEGITLNPNGTTGFVTITASADYFRSTDVGSLLRLQHAQQREQGNLENQEDTSDSLRIAGVGNSRRFTVNLSGFNGHTVVLERAFDEALNFQAFVTYTSNQTNRVIEDNLDNQIVFYRVRLTVAGTGTIAYNLFFRGGLTQGVARIVDFTSATSVTANVLDNFGSATATSIWDRGSWSDRQGWPNTITFFDGRIWWGRGDRVYGSVSDDFANYDDETEGDSAPVIRSVGTGPEQGIVWLLPTQRLLAGSDAAEVSIRASSFDEPITPTNFVPRDASTRGCANIQAVKVDTQAVFVQKGGERIYLMQFDANAGDYVSLDLTELNPEICVSGVRAIAVQRNPDTVIWFVLNNGQMRTLTYEPTENVLAWARTVTTGTVTDVIVLPGSPEDQVIILVDRPTGLQVPPLIQCLERFAPMADATGGTVNKVADAYVEFLNSPAASNITGLAHLEGQQVVVWADGAPLLDIADTNTDPYKRRLFTVSSGEVDLGVNVTRGIVGLPYTGQWTSVKLAYASARGTGLLQRKRLSHLGLYLTDTTIGGLRIGTSLTDLQGLRRDYKGRFVPRTEVFDAYDYDASQFNGTWDTDSRINIEAAAPFSATIGALAMSINTKDLDG